MSDELNLDLKDLRNNIIFCMEERARLSDKIGTLMSELRKNCKHEVVVETPCQEYTFFSTKSPGRICVTCCLEEEGWGCGYDKLAKSTVLKEVGRSEFYQKYRQLLPLKQVQVPQTV